MLHSSSNNTQHHHHHQSFSSSLLDAIYRSFDDNNHNRNHHTSTSMRENRHHFNYQHQHQQQQMFRSDEELANFRRACMIEKWMQSEKKTTDDFKAKKFRKDHHNHSHSHSHREKNLSSSSSDSSFFSSSSELDSSSALHRPKPVRTINHKHKFETPRHRCEFDDKPNRSSGSGSGSTSFFKTKSRALKLYADLKKVKQPISPGGKLAGFLNSLFANQKKHKPKSGDSPPTSMQSASTCSSASSFSRSSCLITKTPSSKLPSSTANKRSVRFSPISVILDEDHHLNKSSKFQLPIEEKSLTAEEERINYEYRKKQLDYEMEQLRKMQSKDDIFDDEEEDVISCGSSDLFELENLSAIGMEELPVYETTHFGTNRAILQMASSSINYL